MAQTRQRRRAIKRAEAKRRGRSEFGAAIFGVSLLAPGARAATIVVNTIADTVLTDGKCSLREALQNANNNATTNIDCVAGSGLDAISLVECHWHDHTREPATGDHPSSRNTSLNRRRARAKRSDHRRLAGPPTR